MREALTHAHCTQGRCCQQQRPRPPLEPSSSMQMMLAFIVDYHVRTTTTLQSAHPRGGGLLRTQPTGSSQARGRILTGQPGCVIWWFTSRASKSADSTSACAFSASTSTSLLQKIKDHLSQLRDGQTQLLKTLAQCRLVEPRDGNINTCSRQPM